MPDTRQPPPRRLVWGPPVRLPQPLDTAAERWAGLPPRARALVVGALVAGLLLTTEVRVALVQARWGGAPVPVLVAPAPLPAGADASALRRARLPPAAVPPGAVRTAPAGARLALPLGTGGVLTEWHLRGDGPAAGLSASLRALPVPVEDGWGVTAGGWVDLWVLSSGAEPALLVARARPVLEVRDAEGQPTALVGLTADEVAAATAGLAVGRVLLAHSPAPGAVSIRRP